MSQGRALLLPRAATPWTHWHAHLQSSNLRWPAYTHPPALQHANSIGITFGGQVMRWMEQSAFIAASRVARGGFLLTAAMDSISFLNPTRVGDTVYVEAQVGEEGWSGVGRDKGGAGRAWRRAVFGWDARTAAREPPGMFAAQQRPTSAKCNPPSLERTGAHPPALAHPSHAPLPLPPPGHRHLWEQRGGDGEPVGRDAGHWSHVPLR